MSYNLFILFLQIPITVYFEHPSLVTHYAWTNI